MSTGTGMKILHLAPLWFPVSPNAPGGIETYLPGLIAALEQQGCENALIAPGDSCTRAVLIPAVAQNLCAAMEAGTAWEYPYYEQHQVMLAIEHAREFDVVHSHLGWGGYVLSQMPGLQNRVLHTQHNPVTPDLQWFSAQHPDLWFSTVSEFQARRFRAAGAQRCRAIYNGIDVHSYTFSERGTELLLFLGRMEYEKGPDLAVQVARQLGRPLVLAGPIVDRAFFDEKIAPFLDEQVRYIGVVDHAQKNTLYGQAGCVLMTSRWDEPFGLVAIEAMACGTPVVALANGALPEIVEPGVTGFLACDDAHLADFAVQTQRLDRRAIRSAVEARFDMPVVAGNYRELYAEMMGGVC